MRTKPGPRHSQATNEARKAAPAQPVRVPCPIVGVGASAGGREALEQFLGHVPAASGMAFVIVTHLDPTRKGIMPELLQRATPMRVIQVRDRTAVRPDCVYVIPPNRDMSILHGVLPLFEQAATRGLRLPIDSFLRSLADRVVLQRHAQPAVLVNDKGDIVCEGGDAVHGRGAPDAQRRAAGRGTGRDAKATKGNAGAPSTQRHGHGRLTLGSSGEGTTP